MKLSVSLRDARVEDFPGRRVWTLLDPSNVGSIGFIMGLITYYSGCVVQPHTHQDQEGLYVLKGKGRATVDGTTVDLEPGVALYIPRGATHSVSNPYDEPLEAVLAHAPVCD